jgi:hypothetical protein
MNNDFCWRFYVMPHLTSGFSSRLAYQDPAASKMNGNGESVDRLGMGVSRLGFGSTGPAANDSGRYVDNFLSFIKLVLFSSLIF